MSKGIKTPGQEGILPTLRRVFWLGAIALGAVALTFALLFWLNQRSLDLVVENQRTARIARETREFVVNREAAVRGYLLSHKDISLARGFARGATLGPKLDSLVLLSRGNTSQHDRARTIRSAVDRWERAWARPALDPRTAAAGVSARYDLAGKELFDSIKSAFDSFLAGEQRMFSMRVTVLTALQRFTFALIIAEMALLLGVLIWLRRRSLQQARQVIDQQEHLQTQAFDLQQQTSELGKQAVELRDRASGASRNAQKLAATNENLEAMVRRMQAAESKASSAVSLHKDAQSLLDFVLNSSPVGVALFDDKLRIVRVNAAIEAITGLSASEHHGQRIADIVSDNLAVAVEPVLERVLSTGAPAANLPLNGASRKEPLRERYFLCSFFPVTLPGGSAGVGAIVLETTRYRQLEEQLLQAQKMEAVGRLAGGVAHDFNNMLTAIKSYSELLRSEMAPGSSQSADLLEITKAADRATALTRQLLAFSRQQVLRPSRVDLNGTVDGLTKMLKRLATRNIELSCVLTPNLWPVTADATELERVITNLVLNARDAMPGGGKLIIETSNVEIGSEYVAGHADIVAGPYVLLAVTDTGVGMSREVRERLFEPFFTTKEKGKGTGLGLSSVYGIVKQSGGFVWVYSEPGIGTTFKIYLPRGDEQPPRAVSTPARNRTVGAETILLVEDTEEVRRVAARILRRNGYRVLEAANGAEALSLCDSEPVPVDLIVTDIVMPTMGGAELAERIRKTQPDARILFTSGFTENAAVRQSFMQPGEAFIEKPFTPASLAQKARELLDSSGGEEAT
ncbi:MAG: ATP-binding protein [Gemmatimonadales bacterium]